MRRSNRPANGHDYYGRPVHLGEFGCFMTADPRLARPLLQAFRETAEQPGSAGPSGTGRPAFATGTKSRPRRARHDAGALRQAAVAARPGDAHPSHPYKDLRECPPDLRERFYLMTSSSPNPPASTKKTNRLAGETSPYLLQHATNPVDWYPWGAEASARPKPRTSRSSCRSATRPATGAT